MCTKMRRLVVQQDDSGFVTQHGLMAVAKGCHYLEKIIIYAADMTNEALETLATNCPNLTDIRICLVQKYHDAHPVSLALCKFIVLIVVLLAPCVLEGMGWIKQFVPSLASDLQYNIT